MNQNGKLPPMRYRLHWLDKHGKPHQSPYGHGAQTLDGAHELRLWMARTHGYNLQTITIIDMENHAKHN